VLNEQVVPRHQTGLFSEQNVFFNFFLIFFFYLAGSQLLSASKNPVTYSYHISLFKTAISDVRTHMPSRSVVCICHTAMDGCQTAMHPHNFRPHGLHAVCRCGYRWRTSSVRVWLCAGHRGSVQKWLNGTDQHAAWGIRLMRAQCILHKGLDLQCD